MNKYKKLHHLNNGDIFSTYGLLLEFENDIFYGVVEKSKNNYKRTGISFNRQEITKLMKEIPYWNKFYK